MTRARLLTVDLGNTGGSLAIAEGGGGSRPVASWGAEAEVAALDAALASLERTDPGSRGASIAALSAVASPDRERAARVALERRGLGVVVHPDPGLEFRIERPETCGADRKYAARGALAAERLVESPAEALLVVDAGTALTVDAVLPVAGDSAAGAFLGGAIALGPRALAGALANAGARLPEVTIALEPPALGRSTEDALRSGIVVGFRGAVRELSLAVAREAFPTSRRVRAYLTGGSREYARAALLEQFADLREDPLLVHRGLAAAAMDAMGD